MENERPDFHRPKLARPLCPSKGPAGSRAAPSLLRFGAVLLLGLMARSPALGQTTLPVAPVPRPLNPVLSGTGGSCATLFAPCPAISRLGLFIWVSGQYLGSGLGGDSHTSTLGGSVDVAMEVANRVAVSASIPGALNRIKGQFHEELWGIGGPLEARARVRLGPTSHGFYSIQARPLWSSVIEIRTQFLIPGLDGDSKYVGRVQRGAVQPAVYGAGELNVWRLQFAPGVGILVGDRQAHADLSLRVSVQLLDRLYGDVEVLRRQALSVPAEPGRCQSAWMGAVGARFQFRRGVFMNTRYVGGQGDCVPANSFQANLGLAFGDGLLRIPNIDELGFIKKYHALLMGMIDPVLDCQGIMRADDGTPLFRFGYPDARDPRIIRRNNVEYHVGEHFWEKNGNLYRDTDLSHPVLDLHGEQPLTFAERAAMHDCPTLPGLGSPCQVALNLPTLRHNVEHSDNPMQLVLNEDAQILACLNHLSPLKAAAVFASLQAAMGPLLVKLPQVARWGMATAPTSPIPSVLTATPATVASASPHASLTQPGSLPKVAAPAHAAAAHNGQRARPHRKPGGTQKSAEPDESPSEMPQLPSMPGWLSGESSRATADNTPPSASPTNGNSTPPGGASSAAQSTVKVQVQEHPTLARNKVPPAVLPKVSQRLLPGRAAAPASDSGTAVPRSTALVQAPEGSPPESSSRLCGTYCQLTIGFGGVITAGAMAAGVEVAKDVGIGVAAAEGGHLLMGVAGVAVGGTAARSIAVDGLAEHDTLPGGTTAENGKPRSERVGTSTELTTEEIRIANEARTIMNSTAMAQIRTAHSSGQSMVVQVNGRLIQYEPGLPASGMTMFGENGFLIGNEAFQSEAELTKTLLHELHRLSTSNVQVSGVNSGSAAAETEAAFQFAEKAYKLLSRAPR